MSKPILEAEMSNRLILNVSKLERRILETGLSIKHSREVGVQEGVTVCGEGTEDVTSHLTF